jgi:hypothetical protein
MENEVIIKKLKNFFKSENFKIIIYIFGVLGVVILIFQAGMSVGFKKASFERNWENNYERNFGSPHRNPKMELGGYGDFGNLPNANGAIGRIIKTELPNVIVMDDKDMIEKVIIIDENTKIIKMREELVKEDLKIDDFIIVIGNPNEEGQIQAKLIRLMPAPPVDFNKGMNIPR